MPHERSSFAAALRVAAAPFAFAAIAMILCALALGPSLGLYFAGIVIAVTGLPPLIVALDRPRDACLAAVSGLAGIAIVWLISGASMSHSFAACLILLAAGMSLFGLAIATKKLMGQTLAAAITTILFLAWLSWPVWLSPWLSGSSGARIVAILTPAHPLFALNHIFLDAGLWTQQSLMYQLTALGQDVPYALPATIWPCVLVHGFIALAAWLPPRRPSASLPAAAA